MAKIHRVQALLTGLSWGDRRGRGGHMTLLARGRQDGTGRKDGAPLLVKAFDAQADAVLAGLRPALDLVPQGVEDLAEFGLTAAFTGSWFKDAHHLDRAGQPQWTLRAEHAELVPAPQLPPGLAELRRFVYANVWQAVRASDLHKSSEGWLQVDLDGLRYSWPNVFDDDQRVLVEPLTHSKPGVACALYAYVIGPWSHYEFVGDDLAAVAAQIRRLVAEDFAERGDVPLDPVAGA